MIQHTHTISTIDIWLKSREGEGTTFFVALPVAA